MFFLDIIDLYLGRGPAAGIIGGQPSGFLKGPVRELFVVAFYDDMGSGHFLGVEPPVISCGKFKGQFVILLIVFSHIDMVAVAGNIVQWLGLCHSLFPLSGVVLFNVAVFCQLIFDLGQVVFLEGDIQSRADRF